MAQVTFGTVLREARERKGLDLAAAARRLRIRPDILRAIEENDFSRMPPRGYARNMVNAYARLVGLNPSEMTRMYLDEAYAYQVGRARGDAQPYRSERSGAPRTNRPSRTSQQEAAPPPRQNALGRTMYDDRREYSREYGSRGGGAGRLYPEDRTHPSRHAALPNNQYTNFIASPKPPSSMQSRLPFFVAGGVILVLLIIVLVLFFGNSAGGGNDDAPKVPVTGLTDTTGGDSSGDGSSEGGTQQPVPTETAPTSVSVVYKVASGQEIYAVITTNGTQEPQMITGPVEETVELSADGTWSFATWVSDAVTITLDGEAVAFGTTDESGMPMATVDFNAYLEQWYAAHPNANKTPTGADTADTGTADAGAGDAQTGGTAA